MDDPSISDVIIIGGGPAGSTVATLLAREGFSVQVLERAKFPREHVGESLLPYCYPILKDLGVYDEMVARFVRKPGVRFIDVDGETYTTWCFNHVLKDESYLSFHVLRAEFDELLLNNAVKNGASARQAIRVEEVETGGADGVVVRARNEQGELETFRGRFLVDASGRDTFMANRLKLKKAHRHLDRTALSSHWQGVGYSGGLAEGLLQIVYLGGEKQGWIWVIPVGTDRVSIGVVLNHSYIAEQKAALTDAGQDDWKMALYHQELQSSPFVREILEGAQRVMPLMFNGDYSYTVEKKYGDDFAMVGDAATFIDPIFASGIYLCMNSAKMLAKSVATRLKGTKEEADASFTNTYETINGAYTLVDKAIRMFYNPSAVNFAQMGSMQGDAHQHISNIMAVGHYLLAGDFFENHKKYFEFLDLFQDPKFAGRYKTYVLDRAEYRSVSCGVDKFDVFNEMMADHEARRARDLEKMAMMMATDGPHAKPH